MAYCEEDRRVQLTSKDVGVVAIGRNEGDRLVRCLVSVKACTPNIVYVDSGSTDGSVDYAAEIGSCVLKLDLTRPFTAARARNEGYSALKSLKSDIRFVQFIDGDCGLAPEWLEKARAFIEQENDIAIVCGRRRERYPDASIYNYFCDLEWNSPIGEALACGGDALIRAEAFEAMGGFRSELIAGEEPELCFRLREAGWRIWRLDADMTEHDASLTRLQQWWVRAVRSGYGFADVSWLHRHSSTGIWRREILRASLWAGVLPVTIGLAALLHPATLLGVSVYFLQICRIALKDAPRSHRAWLRALFLTLAQFATLQGILKFVWRKWRRRAAKLIEYK
jgi:glycosyltransferase involved in cell wall biosynthesis